MEIYLVQRSYFTFRGQKSYELNILGKTVLQLMRENLGAKLCDGELPEGDKVVLFPVYPFLTKAQLEDFLSEREGSFSFDGGYVVRGGAEKSTRRKAGLGLFSLADYTSVLEQAKAIRRQECAKSGAFVAVGAEVDFGVILEEGVVVENGACVTGKSVIKQDAVIGAGSQICDSEIGANTRVSNSVIIQSKVGSGCAIGPFSYLRPNSNVGDRCRVGDFVELKNTTLGNDCKASHHSYIGDAEVGERVNIGCGVVFANYNGKTKNKSVVGSDAFLGSNCNLIAPVTVGNGAFLAAGTTLTQDLANGDFCIGRNRETIKPQRACRYLR